jgi:hypothetical protein
MHLNHIFDVIDGALYQVYLKTTKMELLVVILLCAILVPSGEIILRRLKSRPWEADKK